MEIKSLYLKKVLSSKYTPLTWTFLILVLLCLPGSAIEKLDGPRIPHFDKYVHFLLFAGCCGLWSFYLSCKKYSPERLKKWYLQVFLITVIYGAVLEVVQYYFVPDRSFDLGDIAADAAGAFAAYLLFHFNLLKINIAS
ncbi:MAG: VanZ family protein [Chitinophagaceae bacterium]|nr:VanZ family protein [Chitinophagaceae bacterium]